MQIITVGKGISDSTTLPKFEDYYKSLIDPSLVTLSDDFTTNTSGKLSARLISGQAWVPIGTSGDYWTVYNGYIASSTSVNARTLIDHGVSGKFYAAIEYQSGFVGLLVRAVDASNLFQITLASASKGLRVEKFVGGTNTLLQAVGITLTAGKIYQFAVEYDATTIKVYVDNVLLSTISDTALAANTKIGIVTSVTANKIHELVAR